MDPERTRAGNEMEKPPESNKTCLISHAGETNSRGDRVFLMQQ